VSFLFFARYFNKVQSKGNKIGRACSTYGVDEKTDEILVGNPEGKRPLKEAMLDGRIILKLMFRK
jgi:hypothetical protein